jgi:hypothetical protein
MVGRAAGRPTEQVDDALLENLVGGKADRVEHALGFEVLVNLRRGERRVAAKIEANFPFLVAVHHRLQDITPSIGTVHVAGTQRAAFEVAELVEQEQGMTAGATEVAVVGRSLMVTVGRADARIHVQNDLLRRTVVVNAVDPKPGQIGKGGEVVVGGKVLGFEAAHLARGCNLLLHGPSADNPTHGRIVPKTVGIIDVLLAAEPSEHGLTEQSGHPVLSVPSGSRVRKTFSSHLGQSEGIVKVPEWKKPRIGSDLRYVKFQLQPTVEIQPQCPRFPFTHRANHIEHPTRTTAH